MATTSDAADPPDEAMSDVHERPSNYPEPSSKPGYHSNSADPEYIDIKLLFKMTSRNQAPDVGDMHHQVLQAMVNQDPELVVLDQDHNVVSPMKLNKATIKKRYKYTNLPRRHFKLVGVAHKIYSSLSLTQLKKEIQPLLSKFHVTIAINPWYTLDVRDVGWLCNSHPFFHNRDHMRDILVKALRKQFPDRSFPDFHLYVKTVSAGHPSSENRISARAIFVECQSKDLLILRQLLQTLYSKVKGLPGHFVPTNLQHISDNPLQRTFILQQIKYIDEHRNITIEGVEYSHLVQTIYHNEKQTSILSAIRHCSSIFWISETQRDDQWNLSSNVHHYAMATKFVQNLILDKVPDSSSNMVITDDPTANSTLTDNTRSYLEVLSTTSSQFTVSKQPPPSKDPKPKQITISPVQPSQSHVSSLDQPSHKKTSIEIDNIKEHITRSLAKIRKEFEEFKTTIRQEVNDNIKELITDQNLKLTEAVNAMDNTSTSLATEMKTMRNQMSGEIKEIRDMLIHWQSGPPKPAKRHKSDLPLTQDPTTTSSDPSLDAPISMTLEENISPHHP